ncbi:MAG: hypothetical protein J7K53_02990, partial [Bacteroidales bacterium]|nr:hypothetical protein [Bacteroidales bacterium]
MCRIYYPAVTLTECIMKETKTILTTITISIALFIGSCEKEDRSPENNNENTGTQFIADYNVAKESVLRSIPREYIDSARSTLHIAYQHTSHGTHVSRGVFGLQDYKDGDRSLFGITNNSFATNKLDFRDYALSSYAESGTDAADLSRNETAFIQATRNFLDDPDNAVINVVMWSWCNIAEHNVSDNYLPGMETLISEYGANGTKIGTGSGQRETPVTFVFMTGHANAGSNVGDGKPKNQAEL